MACNLSRSRLGQALLSVGLLWTTGCLSFLHPIGAPPRDLVKPCDQLPKPCRDHVYIFFVNGLDPVDYGNLVGLRDYVQKMGFHKTYYGQLYHVPYFESEMCKIHKSDPDARFVLVGFSLGANLVHTLARAVADDGVQIDLMVYLSGNHPVAMMPRDKPDNVCQVLNILASGCMKKFGERDYADNLRLEHTCHFGSPTHPQTLEVLCTALTHIAAQAPGVLPPDEFAPTPLLEEAPRPRPVTPPRTAQRDDWDFLKPVGVLRPPDAGGADSR